MIAHRYFFALDIDKAINMVCQSCYHCASPLKTTPESVVSQTSLPPPVSVGLSFAADIMKRECQIIFALRECVTSYTASYLLNDER